jgi:hypothetical protein
MLDGSHHGEGEHDERDVTMPAMPGSGFVVLGSTVARSMVAKYMAKRADDPSGQRWSTFLRNHMPHIAAIDLFVVPTIGFRLPYVLVIVRLARRELVWINVTAHPTADWSTSTQHAHRNFRIGTLVQMPQLVGVPQTWQFGTVAQSS